MKYLLGIQTAEFPNGVCLIKADVKQIEIDVVCAVGIKEREQTVERLGDSVKKMLKQIKADVSDIHLVAICLGPGSYTGTRGGLAFAKGLCQFLHIPLVGVSAFEVLRENIRNKKEVENVCYLLDARNERVFYVESSKGSEEKQIKADYIANIFENIRQKCTFVGSGAVEYKKIIKEKLKDKAQFAEAKLNRLEAKSVAKAGLRMYKKKSSIFSKDYLYKIVPLYILPPTITKLSDVCR